MPRTIAVNERGLRIGEDHQNAKYTNHEVEMVLDLRDEKLSYREISVRMDMPKSTVRDICKGNRRCQTADRWKEVKE